jgi:hypothetical protein
MAVVFGLIFPCMLHARVMPFPHDEARSFNAPQRGPRTPWGPAVPMLIGRLAQRASVHP